VEGSLEMGVKDVEEAVCETPDIVRIGLVVGVFKY
jgi:hypothetical protein